MLKSIASLLLAAVFLIGCNAAPQTHPVPVLDTKGDVYKTLGPNDTLIYSDAVGTKKTLIIFVDFPDRRAKDETTQQRADKVLGGTPEDGTFQNIFRANSDGKLTLDLTLVHGWRTLPESHKVYDPVTTKGHRIMFEEAFKLYPEIDFNDYDYTMVLMTAKGNFAFGERDDEAINHRGKKITVALNQGSRSPYVLAHELAHCMGLPDLYTYTSKVPEDAPRNPLGPWDIMSSAGQATGFIGWHRHKLGWLDDDRKTYLTQGSHQLTLTPLSADEGISMIVVPSDNADKPSKVFVIEVAQPIRVRGNKQAPEPGGVLVYSVDATLPTGQNPVILYPREDKIHAAFHKGDRFDHDDAPMSVNVMKKNNDGSYDIELTVK